MAQVNLGELYSLGHGVQRDLAAAFFWWSLAAEQGHAWAQEQGDKLAARLSDDDRTRAERMLADWRAGGRAAGGP